MASISVSGTACAALIAASAASIAGAAAQAAAQATAGGGAAVEVRIEGLRNARGQLRLCLTRNPAYFPDCNRDPAAVKRSLPAAAARRALRFELAPGAWALAAIHDENGNGRLDRFMAIPREGFGFSRNPRLRMGPPRFEEARFEVAGAPVRQTVRIRYLL